MSAMTNQMAWIRKRRGFTLVEIIVVLVILAILAAFTIPAMLGFVNEARAKKDIVKAREIYTAAQSAADQLYPEYSTYTVDKNNKKNTTNYGIKYNGKTGLREYENDCSFKYDAFFKIQELTSGDLGFKYYKCWKGSGYSATALYYDLTHNSVNNPEGYVLEVGVGYNNNNITADKQKEMNSPSSAKVMFSSTQNNNDRSYNVSAEAFKVKCVWYNSEDGKYQIQIWEDPNGQGVKTTVFTLK